MKWSTGIAVLFFFALITVIRYPAVVDEVKRLTGLEEHILVPDPWVAAGAGSNSSSGTPVPTPRSVAKSELTADDLRVLALSYINEDRLKFGLDPVTLNDNGAAQSHAEDMLNGRYLGHWWMDGRKPYMVYSEMGGDSYVSENAARSGFTVAEYSEYCSAPNVVCERVDAVEDMKRLHHAMVYDDASSNWGHRENILNPAHRKVSIGIAYTGHFLAFVQHFEGGDVTATARPSVINGKLRVRAAINVLGLQVFDVMTVHREPEPQQRTADEIEQFRSYCLGGGFSDQCGKPVLRIIPPPPPGRRYVDLAPGTLVADKWSVSGNSIDIVADAGLIELLPGVYTVTLYEEGTGSSSGATVLQLTVAR